MSPIQFSYLWIPMQEPKGEKVFYKRFFYRLPDGFYEKSIYEELR